ncbi:MAG: L-threonylcarbamoyladenylate synthase [Rickettsiales bacterium]
MLTEFKKAAELLRTGKLVCLPTDTQYALTCNACDEEAVQSLIAAKGRKPNHPLPILVKDLNQAREHAEFNEKALELAAKYWPGALTLVLKQKKSSSLAPAINQGFTTIAVRQSKAVEAILAEVDFPIVGTSANISGEPTIMNHGELQKAFGSQVSLIIPNTHPLTDLPSTILDLTSGEIKVVREGALTDAINT